MTGVSLVLPVYNEALALPELLTELFATFSNCDTSVEIIVVDDASTDESASLAAASGARVLHMRQNSGYGAALKAGILAASYECIAIMDGDGSYAPADVLALAEAVAEGATLAIGRRKNIKSHDSKARRILRSAYVELVNAALWDNARVRDPNSGIRAFQRSAVEPLFSYLCDGFSFTTSLTMLLANSGGRVAEIDVDYLARKGSSKVHLLRDGTKTLSYIARCTWATLPLIGPLRQKRF